MWQGMRGRGCAGKGRQASPRASNPCPKRPLPRSRWQGARRAQPPPANSEALRHRLLYPVLPSLGGTAGLGPGAHRPARPQSSRQGTFRKCSPLARRAQRRAWPSGVPAGESPDGWLRRLPLSAALTAKRRRRVLGARVRAPRRRRPSRRETLQPSCHKRSGWGGLRAAGGIVGQERGVPPWPAGCPPWCHSTSRWTREVNPRDGCPDGARGNPAARRATGSASMPHAAHPVRPQDGKERMRRLRHPGGGDGAPSLPAGTQPWPLRWAGDRVGRMSQASASGPQGRRPLRPGLRPGRGGAWPMGRAANAGLGWDRLLD